MNNRSEQEILALIHHLRRKSGIKPIPYSQEELNSDIFSTFSSVMAPGGSSKPTPPPRVSETILPPPTQPPPAPLLSTQEPEIPQKIGQHPPHHRPSFSIKC
ncbi:MAG: hypothetical protein HQL72_09350 [Magnetococcales bacterium]|nr:hypothetical protein [Magnetococcales bacterium]